MDIAMVSGVLFFASIAVFAYLVYKLSQKKTLARGWHLLVWVIFGVLTLLSGVISGNAVTIIVGTVMAFGSTSAYLTSYVKSDHRVKRTSEVIFTLLTFGIVVYGYIITRSFFLGVITLFILTVGFVAFVVSYLLPKIRGKSKSYS